LSRDDPEFKSEQAMMAEVRRLASEQARALQLRLNHGRVDPITAGTEACRIFAEATDRVRARWLGFELNGYGNLVDSTPLHVLLGVGQTDRLSAHVAAYRTQWGLDANGAEFRHFFVESLADLVATSTKVASTGGSSPLELEFGAPSKPTEHPRSGSFRRDVFERVVAGFVAALQLELGALTK
jgi:hypothetical protein